MNALKLAASYVNKEELVHFTQQLIQIKSVYDAEVSGENEEKVAVFVADYLKEMGLEVHIDEVVPGRPNVIAYLHGSSPGKTILLEGHTDVVTAGDPDEWTVEPFGGEIIDNRIFGRGACDTKGNLAAAIFAVKAIKESGVDFSGKILLCIPVDEEDMMIGIKHFIRNGWADDVDAAIICEPEENQLCITQRGALRIGVKITGKMAHGAIPEAGINPNWGMAQVIMELEKLQQSEMNRLGYHKYLGYPSITPTILRAPVKGEAQINVIPKECYTTLDIRTVPGQDHAMLTENIRRILKKVEDDREGMKTFLDVIEERPWTNTSMDEPLVKAMSTAYEAITGKEARYNGVPGATDGTFLNAWKDIPIVTTGAGDRLVPHQADEYVEIEQLVEAAKIYAASVLMYLEA